MDSEDMRYIQQQRDIQKQLDVTEKISGESCKWPRNAYTL